MCVVTGSVAVSLQMFDGVHTITSTGRRWSLRICCVSISGYPRLAPLPALPAGKFAVSGEVFATPYKMIPVRTPEAVGLQRRIKNKSEYRCVGEETRTGRCRLVSLAFRVSLSYVKRPYEYCSMDNKPLYGPYNPLAFRSVSG